ncbi:MAG: flavodoxin family protein [Crenarchaeota archaeon]|nr:flavodoxin family protein [Thermoproteota archaeon]
MIVGVSGSPRKQATEYILEQALVMLKEKGFETAFWTVRGKWLEYCTHCDFCLTNKNCQIQDDMEEIYELLAKAKGIIFASPVYNGGVSAQMKVVMDRSRALVAADKNFFKGKIGAGITVAGDRTGGQELAQLQIHTFYLINGMIPVGGGPFGANLGANFWSKDTLADVKLDAEGFRGLKKTMKRFAEFMELHCK